MFLPSIGANLFPSTHRSRTFMRSVVSEDSVGLLLFDEPSASLDPTAEHDLFERLRKLRGNKTMIFSSHRFGNLTRHADLILYVLSLSFYFYFLSRTVCVLMSA